MKPPAFPQRGGEIARDERPIVEQRDERRDRHGFLCRHPEGAGDDACDEPSPPEHDSIRHRVRGFRSGRGFALRRGALRADEGVERGEQEERDECVGAARGVADRGRGERVKQPEHGRDEGQRRGKRADAIRDCRRRWSRERKRPADDAEEEQPAAEVDRDVERVIAARVESADRVVESERQVQDRPAIDRRARAARRGKGDRERPEPADGRIFLNRSQVVEDEGRLERGPVNARDRRHEQSGGGEREQAGGGGRGAGGCHRLAASASAAAPKARRGAAKGVGRGAGNEAVTAGALRRSNDFSGDWSRKKTGERQCAGEGESEDGFAWDVAGAPGRAAPGAGRAKGKRSRPRGRERFSSGGFPKAPFPPRPGHSGGGDQKSKVVVRNHSRGLTMRKATCSPSGFAAIGLRPPFSSASRTLSCTFMRTLSPK